MPACIYQSALLVCGDTRAVSLQTNRKSNAVSRQSCMLHRPSTPNKTSLWYTLMVLICCHLKVLVQWWQNSSPTHNFSHRPACSAEKKKKSLTVVNIILPPFKAQSEIHQKKSARLVFFFCLYFLLSIARELSLFQCFNTPGWSCGSAALAAYCTALALTYGVALRHTGAQVWVGTRG